MPLALIQCACPDAGSADTIARTLVDERLAACVQIVPSIRSTYRWQGTIEQSDEQLVQAKTTRARVDAAIARITALHPYDVPEVVALEITACAPAYAAWVREQVDG